MDDSAVRLLTNCSNASRLTEGSDVVTRVSSELFADRRFRPVYFHLDNFPRRLWSITVELRVIS